jgi:hypothetical protein
MPRTPLGRPQRDINITTTLSEDEYAQLLAWIEKQPDPKPLRSGAVRRFLLAGLGILEKP